MSGFEYVWHELEHEDLLFYDGPIVSVSIGHWNDYGVIAQVEMWHAEDGAPLDDPVRVPISLDDLDRIRGLLEKHGARRRGDKK